MRASRPAAISRREEYAEATRRAIVDAARRLFSKRGYFATKVDDIAALARVAPATVYAVSGGKQGLLHTLMDMATTAPTIAESIARVDTLEDPHEIMRLLSSAVRQVHEEFDDVKSVMFKTAPHEQSVAKTLATATARYRQAFLPIAQRLHELGALREGLDVKGAVDVFWFYFGYSGYFVLRDDNGWSYDHAERWLREEASRAVLRNPVSVLPRQKSKS
jgi:AcrR family transcriptional regulator